MKIVVIFFTLIFMVLQAQAAPLSDKQIIYGYDNCMKFLLLSPAKQAEVAKESHKPLNLVMWACMLQKRQGLKEVLRLNHEYNDWWRHRNDGGGSSSSSDSNARSCVATMQCVGDEQCIGNGGTGTCQSIPGGCDSANSCVSPETCSNGVCKEP